MPPVQKLIIGQVQIHRTTVTHILVLVCANILTFLTVDAPR